MRFLAQKAKQMSKPIHILKHAQPHQHQTPYRQSPLANALINFRLRQAFFFSPHQTAPSQLGLRFTPSWGQLQMNRASYRARTSYAHLITFNTPEGCERGRKAHRHWQPGGNERNEKLLPHQPSRFARSFPAFDTHTHVHIFFHICFPSSARVHPPVSCAFRKNSLEARKG